MRSRLDLAYFCPASRRYFRPLSHFTFFLFLFRRASIHLGILKATQKEPAQEFNGEGFNFFYFIPHIDRTPVFIISSRGANGEEASEKKVREVEEYPAYNGLQQRWGD
jgi:hypothetical protein